MDGPRLAVTPARAVTLRSVTLGLVGVVGISLLTPYNDYVVNNTFLIGNNLPISVVLFLFLVAVIGNGLLARFVSKLALGRGELAVTLAMVLAGCTFPSSGMMRTLPPSLVSPLWAAREHPQFVTLLDEMNLPRWLLPSFASDAPRDWLSDPVVTGFMLRWTGEGSPPYGAWVVPAIAWGVFSFAMIGAVACVLIICRRQWVENERLSFPLATIYSALLEPPPPGKLLNGTLAKGSFWVAFAAAFGLHVWNGLAVYHPTYFPPIPITYNLRPIMADPPFSYMTWNLREATLYLTALGVSFFVPSYLAFSLWFFYLLQQLQRVATGTFTGDPEMPGLRDQHGGAIFGLAVMIIWLGRHHWATVARQAFRGERVGEPVGRYVSYRTAAWGLVTCVGVMLAWLMLGGANAVTSLSIVVLSITILIVLARIVAETGLVYSGAELPWRRPWTLLMQAGVEQPIPVKSFFFSVWVNRAYADTREMVSVYLSHGMRVTDRQVFDDDDLPNARRTGRWIVAAVALAMVVGYVTSFGSTLWMEYRYALTMDDNPKPVNEWGSQSNGNDIAGDTIAYAGGAVQHVSHNPAGHAAFGFGFTLLLGYLRTRFTTWPLHPIGYVVLPTLALERMWFSIFLAWLAKSLIVRFGGSKAYTAAVPFFLGLIVGEALASVLWLITALVLSGAGMPYKAIQIMPT